MQQTVCYVCIRFKPNVLLCTSKHSFDKILTLYLISAYCNSPYFLLNWYIAYCHCLVCLCFTNKWLIDWLIDWIVCSWSMLLYLYLLAYLHVYMRCRWRSRHCHRWGHSSVHWRRNCSADHTATQTISHSSIDVSVYVTHSGPKVLFRTCVAMKFVDDDDDDDDDDNDDICRPTLLFFCLRQQ